MYQKYTIVRFQKKKNLQKVVKQYFLLQIFLQQKSATISKKLQTVIKTMFLQQLKIA